ncbi:uncharacterized protein PHACADRAFT_202506 [Phanerochaete carnosa HHB-10118-sp]|uniref:Uncharacterized protein n=1 Tax=Phanerochaete carnosa (strain HHB-10118-sp) TaxID=650164 RepID=K5WEU6_PHACS|nr:uncharacterized protein PHACADRAFT_202506 [Phanerochaete carnosa HHB-10118-sp]EKM48697.1 hypothetical protein PHACADRAFT_202506 [Phanerochaete carnosa HHB-10118-sp]
MTLRAGFYTVSLAVKLLRRELESPTLHWSHDKEKSEIDSEHALPCYLPLFPAFLALELRGVIYKRPEKRIRQRFDLQSLTICDYTYDSRVQLHQRATIDLLCLFLSFKEPKFQHICPRTRQEDDVEWGLLRIPPTAQVRYLDTSGTCYRTEPAVIACAATLEHLKCALKYSYHHVIELAIHRYDYDADATPGEPWSALAAFVTALRKCPYDTPTLEYIELQLKLFPSIKKYGELSMSKDRHAFSQHQPFANKADAALGCLVDKGLVKSVRVR